MNILSKKYLDDDEYDEYIMNDEYMNMMNMMNILSKKYFFQILNTCTQKDNGKF